MISGLYQNFIYEPMYNALVYLLSHLDPYIGVGGVVIIFTVLVKVILFPLSKAALHNQIRMRELEPKLSEIRKQYKESPQEMSLQTMRVYKENKLNPLSGIFLLIIQIPIIWALYKIFLVGGLPNIHTEILYSFVNAPQDAVNMVFLGIDIAKKSAVLALLAGITQYFQVKYSIPEMKKPDKKDGAPEFGQEMMRAMNTQMKYVLPVIVTVIAFSVNAGIALYWATSNLFAIGQEVLIRRRLKNKQG